MQPPICCIEYQGKIKTYCAVGELNEHMHKFINDFFYNSQSHYCACFFLHKLIVQHYMKDIT
mgnify:CR=1 FL=1